VSDFTKERVLSWLSNIEANGCTISTRNQRLAGIRSFLAFAADEEPVYMDIFIPIGKIHVKKGNKPSKDFLNQEEFQEILKSIPSGSELSIKHYVLLSTLYETGARVQEICDMKQEDISYGKNCSVKIYGKGRKTRIVYISSDMAAILKEYCTGFSVKEGNLFRNRYGETLTDSGIDYIIKKYTAIAREPGALIILITPLYDQDSKGGSNAPNLALDIDVILLQNVINHFNDFHNIVSSNIHLAKFFQHNYQVALYYH